MEIVLPKGFRWDPSLKLGHETSALSARVWPNYLISESDLPEAGLKFEISREELARRFPVWGIRRDDTNELVAFANGVLCSIDLSQKELPVEGWQFAIQSAGSGDERNCLCLLVANVDPTVRGFGFSQILINRAKLATLELGFDTMIAPVRPTLKHESPFTSMKDYLSRRNEKNEIYDPWVNTHVRLGGEILNICSESVTIRASLAKWREWTGLPLLTSGERILPQGLVPLKIDTHRNIGVYSEPNVWLRYTL
jgi:hypothetical protein